MKRASLLAVAALLLGSEAMGDNAALTAAKRAKKDEFYTQRVDIENELRHDKAHFKGKVVLCNCDDPRQSEFFKYFTDDEKRAAYEVQKGVCPICGGHFEYDEMEGDHIVPWSKGGKTVPENLQMLCRRDNALKSDR